MNYIGSKNKLVPFLVDSIENFSNLKGGVFCDAFAGTGVVGLNFSQKGFKVLSNDLQYYSYVINRAQLCTQKVDISFLEYLNSLKGESGYFTEEFAVKRQFFTAENAQKCDSIRAEIDKNKENEDLFYFSLACLLEAMDKVANTASVYGVYLKSFKRSALKEVLLIPPLISAGENEVFNLNANNLVTKIEGDILYLDPPYVSRRYDSNYHVLETIALNDRFVPRGKTGLRDNNEKKSDWCIKSKATDCLIDII